MALVLSAILKANSEAGIAIFLSIRNARAQRDALNAAAVAVLKDDLLETFSALSNVYKSLEGQRNDLAHGVFLISDDILDAILWMDAKEHTSFFAQWLTKLETDINASIDGIKDGLFTYREKDVARLRDDITELWQATMFFWQHLRMPGSPLSASSYQRLRELPQMAREIALLKTTA